MYAVETIRVKMCRVAELCTLTEKKNCECLQMSNVVGLHVLLIYRVSGCLLVSVRLDKLANVIKILLSAAK